jgi:DNA-binding MarR family transcriptional regulator
MMNNQQLGDLLIEINKNLKIKVERDFKKYGIGMGQLQILMVFYASPERRFSQNDLVKVLNVDKGNISRSVMKLQEKTYLSQSESGSKFYSLTESGMKLKSDIMANFIGLNHAMTIDIDASELIQIIMTLKKISKNLEELL